MKKWSSAKVIITAPAHLLEQCFSLFTFSLRQRYHRNCLFKLRNFLSNICINMPIVNWLVGLSCVLHYLESFSYSTCHQPSVLTVPQHFTFLGYESMWQRTWNVMLPHSSLTKQGLGQSQHQPEKRFLSQPKTSLTRMPRKCCRRYHILDSHYFPFLF